MSAMPDILGSDHHVQMTPIYTVLATPEGGFLQSAEPPTALSTNPTAFQSTTTSSASARTETLFVNTGVLPVLDPNVTMPPPKGGLPWSADRVTIITTYPTATQFTTTRPASAMLPHPSNGQSVPYCEPAIEGAMDQLMYPDGHCQPHPFQPEDQPTTTMTQSATTTTTTHVSVTATLAKKAALPPGDELDLHCDPRLFKGKEPTTPDDFICMDRSRPVENRARAQSQPSILWGNRAPSPSYMTWAMEARPPLLTLSATTITAPSTTSLQVHIATTPTSIQSSHQPHDTLVPMLQILHHHHHHRRHQSLREGSMDTSPVRRGLPDSLPTTSLAHPTTISTSVHYTLQTHDTSVPTPKPVRRPLSENFPERRDLAEDFADVIPNDLRSHPTGRSAGGPAAAATRSFNDHPSYGCHDTLGNPLHDPTQCALIGSPTPPAPMPAGAHTSARADHVLPIVLACVSIFMLLVATVVSTRLVRRLRGRRRAGPLTRAAGLHCELRSLGGAAQCTQAKEIDRERGEEEV